MNISKSEFGTTADGSVFSRYTLKNASGASITVTDYGCRLIHIMVPDKQGSLTDVCLNYDTGEQYLQDSLSMGAIVGRCANRIDKGRFTLNGREYQLSTNSGPHHLHGGNAGFSQHVWSTHIQDDRITFSRISPDGEEHYPGNLSVSVTYIWSEDNELFIDYEASCDQDTPFSITSHAYFNLNGQGDSDVSTHELLIEADEITELNAELIPTGTILPVDHTPFDFRALTRLGEGLKTSHPQLQITGTYDQNFVIKEDGFREAAILQSPKTGIRMTCFTDQKGMQLYVPWRMAKECPGEAAQRLYYAVCLETQSFPNAVNIPDFPSMILHAGEAYHSRTMYHFS